MIPVRASQACIVALCFALTVPLLAKDHVGKPVGGGSSISWSIDVRGHEMIELTVITPEGDAYRQEFRAGRDPSFILSQLESVVDGTYSYELRVVPKVSADVKRKLVEAREKNDEKGAKKIRKDAGLLQTVVQSGAFSVVNGSIASPDQVEGSGSASFGVETTGSSSQPGGGSRSFQPVVNDQVIPDDLIVQGSLCVGFDCVNNESFGFDTIRMKENNVRIKAEDTSTGTFPTTDWQLTFNDSASGGASKFSVEDITGAKVPFTITAGAATNSLFIDSTGRVGFRTSTPVLDLHANTSNTPSLRLEQNSSGGFTAQTWDVAGNEANFFIRDVTGGSRLPFRIRPGAPTSSIDIASDGDVGVGTASPNANSKMDLSDSTQLKVRLALTGQEFFQSGNTSSEGVGLLLGTNRLGNRQIWFASTDDLAVNATNRILRMRPDNGDISALATDATTTKTLSLNANGGNVGVATLTPGFPLQVGDSGAGDGNGAHVTTGGVWTNGSSRGFKENILSLSADEAKATIAALQPVRYSYKTEPGEEYVGFIAEDVPELVAQTSSDRKYLSPMDIVATLTRVVQEQQKTIDTLAKKIEELEKHEP